METNKVKNVKDVYLSPQIEVVEMEMQEGVLDTGMASNHVNDADNITILGNYDEE